MHWPGRTIWDTRIQGVCGVLSGQGDEEPAIFVSATFAQVSLHPPRVIVNPNRTYTIEPAIRKSGRFAINVMPASRREEIVRLMKMRRRQAAKAEIMGLRLSEDHKGIPYIEGSLQVIFCEVDFAVDAGDRRLFVSRVLESRVDPKLSHERPLLFADVGLGLTRVPRVRKNTRAVLATTGVLDGIKKGLYALRPPPAANIALNTYLEAGATEDEIEVISRPGLLDLSGHLSPPPAPAIIRKRIGVCVVGTGWGSFHCTVLRRGSSSVRLFVCGQNPEKTARLAKAVKAEDYFIGLDKAVADPRVQAFTLALPHDLHREAAEKVAIAGKHALVEKPIATNLVDAEAMIETAKRCGTLLMVAEDMHFRPAIRETYDRIRRGDIGEPLYFLAHAAGMRRPRGWAAQRERMGGGVLMDMGVHYVRALRLLMGEPDRTFVTKAMQIDTKISGDDSVQVLFSSDAGWQAHMLLSWISSRGDLPDIVVCGDSGTLHLWPAVSYIDYYPAKPPLLPRLLSYVRPYWLQEKLMRPWFARVRTYMRDGEASGYLGEMREFLAAIAEERDLASPAEDARRDLEIVLRCYAALENDRWVTVPRLIRTKTDMS